MPKSTKNNASKSTYSTRIPFRSKDTPINFGELYRNTQGEIFKLVSRAAMYDNPEEFYLFLQSLDKKRIDPVLVLEDDFKSGVMFEICNRFI